ncbi:hypothetical protein AAG594_02865 [Citromicrobium bathyomarinum]|nr:hypothetical protein [Citromicrobium sp.]|tara:strand:- start:815 stop:1072 length:258 start_codon:yes stop_codon:yes gene_type:complete
MRLPSVNRPPSTASVALMIQHGVRVRAWCDTCQGEYREVDLAQVIAAKGPDFDLWGKSTRCRLTPGCEGRNRFYHNARGYFCPLR